MVKTGSKTTLTLYVDRADIDRVDSLARSAQLSRSAMVRRLISCASGAKPVAVSMTRGGAR